MTDDLVKWLEDYATANNRGMEAAARIKKLEKSETELKEICSLYNKRELKMQAVVEVVKEEIMSWADMEMIELYPKTAKALKELDK